MRWEGFVEKVGFESGVNSRGPRSVFNLGHGR